MKVVWTDGAVDDLTGIVTYIHQDSPDAARRVAKIIFEQIASLAAMPHRGRKRPDSSRELIFAPWPYLAVYEVINDFIYIEGIRHAARDWRSGN